MNAIEKDSAAQERQEDIIYKLGRVAGVHWARNAIPGCLEKGVNAVSDRIVQRMKREVTNSGACLLAYFGPFPAGPAAFGPSFWRGVAEGSLLSAKAARSAMAEGMSVAGALNALFARAEQDFYDSEGRMRGHE